MTTTYLPSEDTFLLADYVSKLRGDKALEIGVGSGYVTSILARGFNEIIGTDVDLDSLELAKKKTSKEGIEDRVELILCSGTQPLTGSIFDAVVFNPPYLPSEGIEDRAVDGGDEGGIAVARAFLSHSKEVVKPSGKIIFVLSSLSDHSGLMKEVSEDLEISVLDKRRFFFEELMVVEARHRLKHESR